MSVVQENSQQNNLRVRNPPSDIFNVLRTPPANGLSHTPRRNSNNNDSFTRLFGTPENHITPRRASLTKHDVKNRNPVTGNGVDSYDYRPNGRGTPKVHTERNPVTGEFYTIVSPASTPTKPMSNGIKPIANGIKPMSNGIAHQNGHMSNGIETPKSNGHA